MSGIARVAFDQGMRVSGTDLKESRYTKQLREAGIEVHIGHDPANIPEGNPVIVVSTAILDNNPELAAAKARGLTIWHRAQMLAYLGRALQTLAVAGTHGKTTTSSMLASVLDGMGEDPTFLIGGLSLIHISEPTRQAEISYAVFCLKKKKHKKDKNKTK